MTLHPVARSTSASIIFVGMVIALIIALCVSPGRSMAAADGTQALAPGLGMKHKPSVRVRAIQRALIREGYSVGADGADGRFGPRTAAAVRRLQADHGVRVDGLVGPRTRRALRPAATPVARSARAPAAIPVVDTAALTGNELQLRVVDRSRWAEALFIGVSILIAAAVALVVSRQRRLEAARLTAYLRPAVLPESYAAASVPPLPATEPAVPALALPPAPAPPAGSGFVGYVPLTAGRNGDDSRSATRVIERLCERSGLRLAGVVTEPATGGVLERPELAAARARIADGQAQGLIVSDARRLGPARDLAAFLRWALATDTTVIAADLGLDTSTPEGRRMAAALVTFSGWGTWGGRVTASSPVPGPSPLAAVTAEPGPRT